MEFSKIRHAKSILRTKFRFPQKAYVIVFCQYSSDFFYVFRTFKEIFMLMRKNVDNDVSKDPPNQRTKAYLRIVHISFHYFNIEPLLVFIIEIHCSSVC